MRPLIAMRTPFGSGSAVADGVAEVASDGLVETREHVRGEAARGVRRSSSRAVGGLPRSRRRRGNEGHEGQVASGLARGALQVAVGGRQALPELRALLTGRLLRPNVDAAPTNIDRGRAGRRAG